MRRKVIGEGDSTFVYIMTDSVPEQKFQRTQVTTGMSDGIKIEIKKGVTANDRLLKAVEVRLAA